MRLNRTLRTTGSALVLSATLGLAVGHAVSHPAPSSGPSSATLGSATLGLRPHVTTPGSATLG